jgi:hypothetical protein
MDEFIFLTSLFYLFIKKDDNCQILHENVQESYAIKIAALLKILEKWICSSNEKFALLLVYKKVKKHS